MTNGSKRKSRVSTVLILAMLNMALALWSGVAPSAAFQRVVRLGQEFAKVITTPPQTSVAEPPPTVAIAEPEPTTTAQIVLPCFIASSPPQPPMEGCTTVWAVQLVAYDYEYRDLALVELNQLHNAGMADLALVDSSLFLSLCPDHLLLMQPTFESAEEAMAAALSLQVLASVGTIDIVSLAPDEALRADPDC
jgi:hypothetical protein